MKISRLPDRLDRMPMLKILVFFAAGIALADRYELPLWFLAGAFVVTGVLALSLRSSAATAAMILTAGFAAAQFRAPRATVPRGVHTVYEVTVEGFPADRGRYAVADASVAAWRDPADGRWHASDARIRLYADSLAGLHAGERIRCRGAVRPFRGGAESYRRLTNVLSGVEENYELIFVNDGSRDKTFAMASDIQKKDPHVVLVDFSRN